MKRPKLLTLNHAILGPMFIESASFTGSGSGLFHALDNGGTNRTLLADCGYWASACEEVNTVFKTSLALESARVKKEAAKESRRKQAVDDPEQEPAAEPDEPPEDGTVTIPDDSKPPRAVIPLNDLEEK